MLHSEDCAERSRRDFELTFELQRQVPVLELKIELRPRTGLEVALDGLAERPVGAVVGQNPAGGEAAYPVDRVQYVLEPGARRSGVVQSLDRPGFHGGADKWVEPVEDGGDLDLGAERMARSSFRPARSTSEKGATVVRLDLGQEIDVAVGRGLAARDRPGRRNRCTPRRRSSPDRIRRTSSTLGFARGGHAVGPHASLTQHNRGPFSGRAREAGPAPSRYSAATFRYASIGGIRTIDAGRRSIVHPRHGRPVLVGAAGSGGEEGSWGRGGSSRR